MCIISKRFDGDVVQDAMRALISPIPCVSELGGRIRTVTFVFQGDMKGHKYKNFCTVELEEESNDTPPTR